MQHFQNFFNRTIDATPIDDGFMGDILQLSPAEQASLNAKFDVAEVRATVAGMANSSVGAFGLDVQAVKILLDSEIFAPLVTSLLWGMIQGRVDTPLLLTILTAIPKPDVVTKEACNLRPISVTSIWYRILIRLFTCRLNQFVVRLYSPQQHGFCPGRSTVTAMASIVPAIEFCKAQKVPAYVAALDIHKAYDTVSRCALRRVLQHMGLWDNVFVQVIFQAMDEGPITVTGSTELSAFFLSTCGIKQGCPASPVLFGLLLAGLQRRIERTARHACIDIAGVVRGVCGYADDLKIMATSAVDLAAIYSEVQAYLGYLGLRITNKCKVLVVGERCRAVRLGGLDYTPVQELRFLGVKLSRSGLFSPWRSDFTSSIYGVKGRLVAAGLGDLPQALSRALQVKVVPAIAYGGEIWGSHWVAEVLRGRQSPYRSPRLGCIVDFFKSHFGLPKNSFGAAIYRLANLPTMLQLLLPRICKLLRALTQEQWTAIQTTAHIQKQGFCTDILYIQQQMDHFEGLLGVEVDGVRVLCPHKVVSYVLDRFWLAQEPGSRHAQFYEVFCGGDCVWPFMTGSTSRKTLIATVRFFALQHSYFWGRGRQQCHLCGGAPATISHLLCSCPATQGLRDQLDLPDAPVFLRVALLAR